MRKNSNKGCPRVTESDWEWNQSREKIGEERRERNVRQGEETEVREWKVYGFSREVLIFDEFTYDFNWEVLKFMISTYHFMMCFKHLTKKYQLYGVFWRRRELSIVKYISDFSEISDSMVQKHRFWGSPRRGTDARMHGGIVSFEFSPPERCMRINSIRGRPRVTESDWEWSRSQEKRGERGT